MCVCVDSDRGTDRGSHHPDYDPEVVGEDVVKVRIETRVFFSLRVCILSYAIPSPRITART